MTVLHSRNADAADPADVADAADVKDPQDAAAEPDLRDDLGRYAELGAFTLSADTHAWYAAVDTVATPEDARAASTVLAELRGSDLQQTWEAVTALAAEVKLDEPDTVAKTALLVELLQRVHRTSATLTPAAYDADLAALAAATADSAWRRENGVKLSWLRGRSLRKQAAALATDRRIRREDLHEALTSAEVERRAWAALAPAGTLPVVPADGALVDRTAQAFETINTGLRGLARLLPDQDLDGLAFAELVELVERLATDEGTLYRLPTIRSLRATLEAAGLGDLLAELTAAKADRRAAEAAYAARQALAGGQRDGLTGSAGAVGAEEPTGVEADGPEADGPEAGVSEAGLSEASGQESDGHDVGVQDEGDQESDAEADAEAEAAARQALAGGQRDGLVEEAPVAVPAQADADAEVEADAEAVVDVEADAHADAEVEADADADTEDAVDVEDEADAGTGAEAVEAPSDPVAEATGTESAAVVTEVTEEEAPAAVVSLPAPSPAADDLVAAATAAVPESEAADEEEADGSDEAAAEVEIVAEVVEDSTAAEPEAEAETDVTAEPGTAEAQVADTDAEPEAEAAVVEPESVEPEPVEVATAEVEAPAVESESVGSESDEPESDAAGSVEPEPAAEAPAGRPEKPDFTPGRPVTAYSADELLAVVRWINGDGTERSEEELLRAAMKELGFARLGPRIKEALGAAVAAARG
ncbi:hypothetical protein ABT247_07680 [Kitasatospora sp. NPDC001539]|uniref:hypothetical protein n=1 Tax=Kitasatospora sp. NPDC001539 TaxID=3154384 RepID=UPI00331C4D94